MQFAQVVFADNFHFLQKTLIWFQADKTTPNRAVLARDLPQDQRLRFADRLAWPSDFAMWRRFISFLLRYITNIPTILYSDVLAIFDVWQNACADLRNTVSSSILAQCAKWLQEIDDMCSAKAIDTNSTRRKNLTELPHFRSGLSSIILRASCSEPAFAEAYLKRIISSKEIWEDRFNEIVTFSPTLARSHPQLLVELSLTHLKEELPDEQVAREKAEARVASEHRRAILAIPEAERNVQEKLYSSSSSSILGLPRFSSRDWETLSLDSGLRCFSPPSPLREPFYSLFKSSPVEALQLMKNLCNHAMTAWRQLHQYPYMTRNVATPIPVQITFPWGIQKFWGSDKEYLWFRTFGAPKPLACGFMSLEEWCFTELEGGRQVDELIQQIIEGNECIAILGVAVMLALHTEMVSETIFPLITSQRLLFADHNRMIQDVFKDSNLMGFYNPSDQHVAVIHAANERKVRRKELKQLVPRYVFGNKQLAERTRAAILEFKNNLPFQIEEHRENTNIREYLSEQALEYAELADPENYIAYELKENSTHIAVVHISPSASAPEDVLEIEKAKLNSQKRHLWIWADSAFKNGALGDALTVPDAAALARKFDSETLFNQSIDEDIDMTRGAVAATAAIVLNFRQDASQIDLRWARDLLKRAINTPDKRGVMQSPSSIIPWHQSIFVARGLSADLRENTDPTPVLRTQIC